MIIIKTQQEIEIMREGGKILARILKMVAEKVEPGIGTKELNTFAEQEIRKAGGWPAFKGYHKFPTTLCTCINSEIVHAPALPDRKLKSGDILSIDVGMRYPARPVRRSPDSEAYRDVGGKGLVTDTSITVPVGKISKEAKKLLSVTKKSLNLAIKKIKPGISLGNISYTIQEFVEKNNFNVVRDLVGHGVGKKVHEEPQIPNYGLKNTGPILQAGMTLAIEPMVTAGDFKVIVDKDKQTFKTKDGSLSAHFEHTVLVIERGSEILTK